MTDTIGATVIEPGSRQVIIAVDGPNETHDVAVSPISATNWTGRMLHAGMRVLVSFSTAGGVAIIGAQPAPWLNWNLGFTGTDWVFDPGDLVFARYLWDHPERIDIEAHIIFDASTIGTGQPTLTLPIPPHPDWDNVGTIHIRMKDTGSNNFFGSPIPVETDGAGTFTMDADLANLTYRARGNASGSVPFAWSAANNDELMAWGWYRPATIA